jgi:hypothetical protein
LIELALCDPPSSPFHRPTFQQCRLSFHWRQTSFWLPCSLGLISPTCFLYSVTMFTAPVSHANHVRTSTLVDISSDQHPNKVSSHTLFRISASPWPSSWVSPFLASAY